MMTGYVLPKMQETKIHIGAPKYEYLLHNTQTSSF